MTWKPQSLSDALAQDIKAMGAGTEIVHALCTMTANALASDWPRLTLPALTGKREADRE